MQIGLFISKDLSEICYISSNTKNIKEYAYSN
jgi:hypothetical protein